MPIATPLADDQELRNLEKTSPLPPSVIRKILEDNPKALYGL